MRRGLFLFAIIAAPVFAQTSVEEDKGFLTNFLEENLSGAGRSVVINGFAGALSSQATIEELTVADDLGVWLRLEDVTLDWTRSALLSGRVDVSELSAARIAIERIPLTESEVPSPEAKPFALPELPVSIEIDALRADRIELGPSLLGEEIAVSFDGSLALIEGAGQSKFEAHRLDQGETGVFRITADYANDTTFLNLSVFLEEGASGISARFFDLPGQPSVEVDFSGSGPLAEFTSNLILSTDSTERLSGQFKTSLDGDDQRISLDMKGDVSSLFLTEYRDFFGPNVALQADLLRRADGQTLVEALDLSTKALDLSGEASFGPAGWPEFINLTGTLNAGPGELIRLPVAGTPTTVSGGDITVFYDANTGSAWRAEAHLNALSQPDLQIGEITLDGGGVIESGEGQLVGRYTAALDYNARNVVFSDDNVQDAFGSEMHGELALRHSEDEPTLIDKFTLSGAGLRFEAFGQFDHVEAGYALDSSVELIAEDIERFAGLIGRPLSGAANVKITSLYYPFSGAFDATVSGQTNDLKIGVAQIDPVLTGPANLRLDATRDETGVMIRELAIASNTLELLANMQLSSDRVGGAINLNLADISSVEPSLSGSLQASAHGNFDGQGVGQAVAVLRNGADLAEIDIVTTDDDVDTYETQLRIVAQDLSRYATLVGQNLSGALEATIAGDVARDLESFDVVAEIGTENLKTGIEAIDPLFAGSGVVETRVALRDDGKIVVPKLLLNTPALQLDAELNASDRGNGTARFEAVLSDIGIFASDFSGPARTQGTAERGLDGVWSLSIDGSGPGGSSTRVTGTASESGVLDIEAVGSIPLGMFNGALEPRRLSGIAQYDLRISGAPEISSLRGSITSRGAQLSAPTLGQSLNGISIDVDFVDSRAQLDLAGTVDAGGTVNVRGSVGLNAPYSATIATDLNKVVLRDPTLYDSSISGNIAVTGPISNGATISGVLRLGETNLRVPSSDFGTLGALPEVAHIGAPNSVRRTLSRAGLELTGRTSEATQSADRAVYPIDLLIEAPDRIFIRGRGLDAELGGSLIIGGTTALPVPQGQFNLIRGRLSVLQQRFDLTEGFAAIQGDFSPFVRLLATTKARTGTLINVSVEGPVTEPEVTFTSSPQLPQDEILAQLIFGRDLSQITPFQAVQLASAASTLAGRGGGGIVDSFRSGIGLDDFDVTTDESGNAAVRAGKYISDNIYTDVTVSSEGETEINLNLDISSDITAKGGFTSEGETSLGIFFERDY